MKRRIGIALLAAASLASCNKEDGARDYVPGIVIIGVRDTTQIGTAFHAINERNLGIERAAGFNYSFTLPPDSLQLLKDFFNQKEYINPGLNGAKTTATLYVHVKTGHINFASALYDMNEAHQADFLQVINEKRMTDLNAAFKYMILKVPEGCEEALEAELKSIPFIKWAELNRYTKLQF